MICLKKKLGLLVEVNAESFSLSYCEVVKGII